MQGLPTNHTFVVCAYQDSPYLEQCLTSVLNQSEKSNVLLSTSTCTEKIRQLAKTYDVPLYVNTGAGDMVANWNYAISQAGTDFVTVCHQDDYYHPDFFKHVRPLLDDKTLMVHTNYYDVLDEAIYQNPSNKIRCMLNLPLRIKALQGIRFVKINTMRLGDSVCCPSCTYNVKRIGQPVFASKLKSSCDWDLYVDLALAEGALRYTGKRLCYKRGHQKMATADNIRSGLREAEDLYMFNRLWPKPLAGLLLRIYKWIYQYSL